MSTSQTEQRFSGKVAVITGGASGMGLKIASRLLAEGACVVLADIAQEGLENAAKDFGERAAVIRADVSQEADVEAMVALAVEKFGSLDLAVNCASVVTDGVIVDIDVADWERVFAVTSRGVFLSIKHEARQMIKQRRGGSIVTITSINSVTPVHGAVAYNAAKAAAAMTVQNAALELGEYGIRSNAIAPGLIATPMTEFMRSVPGVMEAYMQFTPLGRVGQTEDVASTTLFLLSDEASFLTGLNLLVDGGHRTVGYPNLTKLFEGYAPPAEGRVES
jgi:NAD(P)-dependent dehydrogenase (short-subunit alcohol dehydrogenase family)